MTLALCNLLRTLAACLAILCLVGGAATCATAAGPGKLVVHEWGTFTSLHDESGRAVGGINSDDEPVPPFVHRIAGLLQHPAGMGRTFSKSVPRAHRDVTMRLETPVVYFHPAPGAQLPLEVDFEVAFRGGWLSEYYPLAEVEAPGVLGNMQFGRMTPETVGRLRWNNLQVGTDYQGPETDAHVWLAPRGAQAANVTTPNGESERFLFYRRVGNVESPLRVARDASRNQLIVTPQLPAELRTSAVSFRVPRLWLVAVRADGTCAFQEVDGFEIAGDAPPSTLATLPADFDEAAFGPDKLQQLRASLKTCLIDDGLFDDEADALLATWQQSYFQTPGLRLFFLLPRVWTDHVLPVQMSVEADLVRTMVGRIEIVTPAHRQLLEQIARGPASSPDTPDAADFRAYTDLGRFRNALVLDELEHHHTPALAEFVKAYSLQGYWPPETATEAEKTAKR